MISKIRLEAQPSASCSFHRCIQPLQHLEYNIGKQVPLQDARIVFFNRIPNTDIGLLVHNRQKYGYKIIVDIDDFWELYPDHYIYANWKRHNMATKILWSIHYADAVITTNNVLAGKIKAYNKNVHIIPNALPFDEGHYTMLDAWEGDIPGFIYAGGGSHKNDVALLSEPIKRLYDDYKRKWQMTLAGYSTKTPHEKQAWLAMEHHLTGAGAIATPSEMMFYRKPAQPLMRYMSVYENSDISLIPLVDNDFNRCKSNLKVLEAGARGLAAIASKIHPYYNQRDKKHVIYAENAQEWYEKMRYCIENPSFYLDKADSLSEHVRAHYSLKDHNRTRLQLFEHYGN